MTPNVNSVAAEKTQSPPSLPSLASFNSPLTLVTLENYFIYAFPHVSPSPPVINSGSCNLVFPVYCYILRT